MRATFALLAALAFAACQAAPEHALFDPTSLRAGAADETTALTGWLSVTGDSGLVLYPTRSALAAKVRPGCISVRPLSMAGIVTPAFQGRRITVQGQLTADAASACAIALIASDIGAP